MKYEYIVSKDGNIVVKSIGNNPYYDGIICDIRTWNTPLDNNAGITRAKAIVEALNKVEAV